MQIDRRDIGYHAEQLARNYLEHKGYKLIDRNFSCKLGEIDLIMQIPNDSNILAIVEVRSQSKPTSMHPLESIGQQKIKRIIQSSQYFLKRSNLQNWQIRFDVVSVQKKAKNYSIEHIANAFTEEDLDFRGYY